jgi:hypothetical protein
MHTKTLKAQTKRRLQHDRLIARLLYSNAWMDLPISLLLHSSFNSSNLIGPLDIQNV